MKIFLTGASGMLAAEIIPKLIKEGHEVIQTDARPRLPEISQLDIINHQQVKEEVLKARPDYVFHLAAETNVDLCQQEPDYAFRINFLGTENMALICREADIPLLYISTAAVFHGDKQKPYNEFDETFSPANKYGESKLRGEQAVKSTLR